MQWKPRNRDEWENAGLSVLIALVLATSFVVMAFAHDWLFESRPLQLFGEALSIVQMFSAIALGFYSFYLLSQMRFLLGLLGLVVTYVGAFCGLPCL